MHWVAQKYRPYSLAFGVNCANLSFVISGINDDKAVEIIALLERSQWLH